MLLTKLEQGGFFAALFVLTQPGRERLTQTVLSGYAGTSYLSAMPDTDMQFTQTYTTTSPEIRYTVNFTMTGVYTVWLRGYAPNGAGDSLYVGLDEETPNMLTGFDPQAWSWANTNGQNNPVTIELNDPGYHTLHLWVREDGLRLDRILLTTDNNYNPIGNGPPESEVQ